MGIYLLRLALIMKMNFKIIQKLFVLVLCLSSATAVRNSTGRHFAIAFPAAKDDSFTGLCTIYVNAARQTDVTFTYFNVNFTVIAGTQDTLKTDFGPGIFRLVEGTEDKVIYVDTTDEVSVSAANTREDNQMTMTQALPRYNGTNDYYVMSHLTADPSSCTQGTTLSYFSVAAFDDNTHVDIYEPGSSTPSRTVTLNRFQAYTERNTGVDIEMTGYRIVADKAVSVTSGNSCSDVSDWDSGPIASSMPTVPEIGSKYISPEVFHWGERPHLIRVLGLNDGTIVYFENSDVVRTVDAGEFIDQEIESSLTEVLNCSMACLVGQYGLGSGSAFMTILPSTHQFVTHAEFTYSNADFHQFVFVILLSNDVSGITIDGGSFTRIETFEEYSWLISDSTLTDNWHVIDSDVPFSVLVFGTQYNTAYGYGYNAAFNSMGREEPEKPPVDGENPKYEISMSGSFFSSTGQDFDQTCTLSYSGEMNDQCIGMVAKVNGIIGSELCTSLSTEDLRLVSAASVLQTQTNQGQTQLFFIMQINSTLLSPSEIENCGQEIDDHLMDHSNWPSPILPPVSGCPDAVFTSGFFNDTGNSWRCLETLQRSSKTKSTAVRYSLVHTGSISTEDGSEISMECSGEYLNSFYSSTSSQVDSVNAMMASGALCSDTSGVILESFTTTMSVQANVGQTSQDYLFQLGADTPSSEMYSCAAEVSSYLQPHTNWPPTIIETPGGCPALVFNPLSFQEEGQDWICIQ